MQVLDGTGGTLAASGFNFALGQTGFKVLAIAASPTAATATEIRYAAGNPVALAKAEYLARWLDGPHSLVPVLFLDPATDVQILLGRRRAGRAHPARRPARAPRTCRPRRTTTTTTTTTAPTVTTPATNLDGSPAATTTASTAPPSTSNIPVAHEGGATGDLNVPPAPC